MDAKDLELILQEHKEWLYDKTKGKRACLNYANLKDADLKGACLYGAELRYADLRNANLEGANLWDADLKYAYLGNANLKDADLLEANLKSVNLHHADLSNANLGNANLWGAILKDANLSNADLSYANLKSANLCDANLCTANLCNADLRSADLSGANLSGIKTNELTSGYHLVCPEKGSFTAFKKAQGKVIELFIPKSAKRSSAASRKCRCDKAKVIAIYEKDGTKSTATYVKSDYSNSFFYSVGKMVNVKNFDDNRWYECSSGIHFFMTFAEAKSY